ncbi:peptide chain release factor 1, mitochondrial isoform X1 [Aegilops tauschii subsp. strangulata]|uniref:peptide chain release factor 1, mitochondrial isoform X1 n=1 Tax=Aegilops tauschii subsp. strangulata TaxID=200361 RepID=UPI00098AD698
MQHQIRRCGAVAFAALRRVRQFPHPAVAAAAPPTAAWRCPYTPRLYSTADMSHQLPANLVQIMEQRMKLIEQKSAYLQEQINQPAASPEEYSRANKEFHKLESTMELIKELRSKQKEIEGLTSLVTNSVEEKDMREMAAEELLEAVEEEKRLQHELFRTLLPKDEADERDCILEVRAGTGGEEASLFAMDIFKMSGGCSCFAGSNVCCDPWSVLSTNFILLCYRYEKYSQNNGWKFDTIDIMESAVKGYKEASGTISGSGVYGKLKFESGIHRVQRVPVTEKSGRVHTSAVSVAVLPQADEVDVQLRNEDLRIDTYRSGGSGGQSVNTTDSAVRITHLPTGTVVAIQDERSQHQNKAKALKVLRARLYELERHRLHADRSKLRSEQIGSGDRSERIRTYNFPQGRVTDHRVGVTHHSIVDVMEGESLDVFIEALLLQEEMDAIASFAS